MDGRDARSGAVVESTSAFAGRAVPANAPLSRRRGRAAGPECEGMGEVALPKYDLAIIGSGPGGYVTAIRAGAVGPEDAGHRERRLPRRHLPARRLHPHQGPAAPRGNLRHIQERQGIRHRGLRGFKLNWPAMLARKDRIVNRHAKGIEFLFRKNKVETHAGLGPLGRPGTRVGGDRTARSPRSRPPTSCSRPARKRARCRASSSTAK